MATFYTAHQPDADGVIHYSNEEHGTWQILNRTSVRRSRWQGV